MTPDQIKEHSIVVQFKEAMVNLNVVPGSDFYLIAQVHFFNGAIAALGYSPSQWLICMAQQQIIN